MNEPIVFSLNSGASFARQVAERLGVDPGTHEERDFEDGEHKIRPLQSVRARDVYVVQSLHGDAEYDLNDKFVRLLFLLGALRESGAARVTAVVPYLCYARKERQTKARDPITTRYVAQLFEAMGVDRMVTLDVHNLAGFQNAFRCQSEHLSARGPLIDWLRDRLGDRPVTVASPDVGGVKRAERFREALERQTGREVGSAFMEKFRSEGTVRGSTVLGEIEGRTVLVLDDLIAGGGTMTRAADAFVAHGAKEVVALATHGLFTDGLEKALDCPSLSHLAVSNSVPVPEPPKNSNLGDKLSVVDIAPLIAEAIKRLHAGGSLTELDP
ncbi:ribose-phosphate diphosphokinase [Marinimicrobium locisalis]|uniref:ribose-phosphate diphosphokinase n=1 Tax=Marinimicrobium locisalis TaxID=546022 RepID=UPI003221DE68